MFQVIGASFMTSFLTDVALSVTMILHRVAYTFYPYKASRVLTSRALKVCVSKYLYTKSYKVHMDQWSN